MTSQSTDAVQTSPQKETVGHALSAETKSDLLSIAGEIDDIEVDENGLCKWADVANAQTHIRARLRRIADTGANARLFAAPDLLKALEECSVFLRDLTYPDRTASGPDIIATFGNAVVLSAKVSRALSAANGEAA